jgi:hypothetical protein
LYRALRLQRTGFVTSSPLHLFTSSPLHPFIPSSLHPFIHSPRLLSFHLRSKPAPKALVVIHGLAAAVAPVMLIVYAAQH